MYEATVEQQNNKEVNKYIGLTETPFKTRYNHHNSNFNLSHKKSATTLSEHIWDLKSKKIDYNITWKVIATAQSYSKSSKKCNLCLTEKYYIITRKPSLNKRREIYATCLHRKKHLLKNFKQ